MKRILVLFLLVFFLPFLSAQALNPSAEDALLSPPSAVALENNLSNPVLPDGFDTIRLASSLATVQEALQTSTYFFYRGPTDVSFRPFSTNSVIDVEGLSLISRASLQFDENNVLVSLLLFLDPKQLDYYTIYNTLRGKYQEPESVDPSRMVWNDGNTTLVLEKPLTVKYLQTEWFTTETNLENTSYDEQRNNFLKNF